MHSLRPARLTILAAAVGSIAVAAMPAHAQTDNAWTGDVDSNWNNTDNWELGTPTSSHRATIGGGAAVILDLSPSVHSFDFAAGTLISPNSDTTRTITFSNPSSNAGTIRSDQGGALRLLGNGQVLTNSGTIEAVSGSTIQLNPNLGGNTRYDNGTTGIIRNDAASVLSFGTGPGGSGGTGDNVYIGGGTVRNDGTSQAGRRIVMGSYTGSDTGLRATTFENNGAHDHFVPANATSAGAGFGLTLLANSGSSLINTGTMTFVREYNNSSATTRLDFRVENGNTLENSGTITLRTEGATTLNATGGARLVLGSDTVINNGTINVETLNSISADIVYTSNSSGTFSGTGEIVMTAGSRIFGSGASLTQAAGHTIRGAGSFGGNNLVSVTNNGTIHADSAAPLTFDPNSTTGTFTNNALIRASGAGGMVFADGNHVNAASGTYQIDAGSSLTIAGAASVSSSGTITGAGTVTGLLTLQDGSTLNPTGVLTLDDVTVATGSDIGVDFALGVDQITLTGGLAGSGSLLFDFGGTGQANETYTLFTFDSVDGLSLGDFSYTNLAAGLDGSYLQLNSNTLQLVTVPEPTSALLALGLGGLFLRRRRI